MGAEEGKVGGSWARRDPTFRLLGWRWVDEEAIYVVGAEEEEEEGTPRLLGESLDRG